MDQNEINHAPDGTLCGTVIPNAATEMQFNNRHRKYIRTFKCDT